MLEDLGIKAIRLLTNNPDKLKAFANTSIQIVSREPIIIEPQKENLDYLKTKQEMMGHLLSWK
jgi:3,4-dihydroxy 2-butanone 4-phosphate synthase/GTP cyclohydrolase II